tara:strand:- start:54 stop:356 length:303 start_codon:yes stop_codon:yes gene_type:complete
MTIFYLSYILLTLTISFLFTLFVHKRFSKLLLFCIVFSVLGTFWFKNPGDDFMAPAISIFLLESTILEKNGILRLLRPMFFVLFSIAVLFFFFFLAKKKN